MIDSARFLIAFSVIPSVQTGGSSLHIAAAGGNLELVQHLVREGAGVNEEKSDGNTPIIVASAMGHAKIVSYLLSEGAFVDHIGKSGATALMIAAAFGHLQVPLLHGAIVQ